MKIGVIHGPAGNALALKAADEVLNSHGVESKVCLGGVVGVYSQIEECLDFLISNRYVVLGSHIDRTFANDGPYKFWSTVYLVGALTVYGPLVSGKTKAAISCMPSEYQIEGIEFGSVNGMDRPYVNSINEAVAYFGARPSRIFVSGQRRSQTVFDMSNIKAERSATIETSDPKKYFLYDFKWLLSPGTIGSVYTGSRYPSLMIVDTTALTAEIVDLSTVYRSDIESVQRLLGHDGLAKFLSENEFGKKPHNKR